MQETDSLLTVKGIGEKTQQLFAKIGIFTVGDLLRHYPADYDEPGDIIPISGADTGKKAAVRGRIAAAPVLRRTGHLTVVAAAAEDESGRINLAWFHMPYMKNQLKKGDVRVFRGRVTRSRYGISMDQPAVFKESAYEAVRGRLQPVYLTTRGLSSNAIGKAAAAALDSLDLRRDYLPEEIRSARGLAEWNYAVRVIHFPPDREELLFARRRLVFDEFFLFILMLRRLRGEREQQPDAAPIPEGTWTQELLAHLPYQLTEAQQRVWGEIRADLAGGRRMNRLIQGDVGSGKTILAFLALLAAAQAGFQASLMVPTEVLARQHFDALLQLIADNGLPVVPVLLTGSLTAAAKRKVCGEIRTHQADIVIGTHALIQDRVEYDRLGLVITDEQHRFGVRQREILGSKGDQPHVLVMSATPIPRTLAIILYGDLDISVLDQMPQGRQPIRNCLVDTAWRRNAYRFIQKEIAAGHQAYVICPMAEESEGLDAENVVDYTAALRQEMPPSCVIEYLHGKLRPAEKNKRMERFLAGEIQILVSTTVVEVGVNVPNATVMMIENAERFGLAQLHQLRGRVGRGSSQSYCIFVDGSGDKEENKRLSVLNQTNDGFRIASEDLKLRGPGDVFGIRQSGELSFAIGDIFTDSRILSEASEEADRLLREDPDLTQPAHRELKQRVNELAEGHAGSAVL